LTGKLEAAMKEKVKLETETVEKSLLDSIQAKLAEALESSLKRSQEDAARIDALTKSTTDAALEIEKLKVQANELTDQLKLA